MLDYYLFKQVQDLFLEGKSKKARRILKELQDKYIELCDENMLLKTQVQEFEDILYLAKNLEYDGRSYWLKTGTIKQGPFCQNCFDKEGLLIRLYENDVNWKCLTCGEEYERKKDMPLPSVSRPPLDLKANGGKVIQLYK